MISSINDLSVHDINTNFVLMDIGYFTDEILEAPYIVGIDFIIRILSAIEICITPSFLKSKTNS